MSFLTICTPTVIALLFHPTFSSHVLTNIVTQVIIFLVTAHVPALVTGRMSYVDIAWPWGLIAIGVLPLISPPAQFSTRSYLVMAAYFAAGGRMALGEYIL